MITENIEKNQNFKILYTDDCTCLDASELDEDPENLEIK